MSAEKPTCARCGRIAESHNWENESTFWGWFGFRVVTVSRRLLRVKSQYYRRNPEHGSPLLVSDDLKPLCDDCWGDLIGLFLQGRALPPVRKRQGSST